MTPSDQMGEGRHWPELDQLPKVRDRVLRGQKFNGYDSTSGDYIVAIGPVTDCLMLARVPDARVANLLVAALRIATGQPSVASPLEIDQ